MKINRENKMLNITGDDEFKEIEEFKKKNKKYLAARHKTDQHIRVTRPGNKKPALDGKSR